MQQQRPSTPRSNGKIYAGALLMAAAAFAVYWALRPSSEQSAASIAEASTQVSATANENPLPSPQVERLDANVHETDGLVESGQSIPTESSSHYKREEMQPIGGTSSQATSEPRSIANRSDRPSQISKPDTSYVSTTPPPFAVPKKFERFYSIAAGACLHELQRELESEAPDGAWSQGAQAAIEQALNSHPDNSQITRDFLECRATGCLLLVSLKPDGKPFLWEQLVADIVKGAKVYSYSLRAESPWAYRDSQVGDLYGAILRRVY